MPTFTKLFPIRIVASKDLGRLSKLITNWFFADFFDFSSFSSDALSEKQAISEADIAAEQNKRITTTKMEINNPRELVKSAGMAPMIKSCMNENVPRKGSSNVCNNQLT